MVQVPTTQGRAVQVQAEPGNRLRYAQGRDYMGRAVEDAGRSLGQAARDWDEIEATYDEADALRIANEFSTYERERLKTGENAYLSTQGFTAGEGREGAVKDLETASENLLGGARSERAKKMAQRALMAKMDTATTQIANHAVGQMRVARTEQRQAQMSSALTDAVDARGTEQFAVNLGVADMALSQMAADMGWSPEKLEAEREAMVSGVHGQVVLAIDSEDGEPTAALEYLDANKDLIGPEMEARLRNSLTPRVDAAWADDIVRGGELVQYLPGSEPVAAPADGDPTTIALTTPFAGKGVTVPGGRYGAARSYGGHSGVDFAGIPAGTPVPPAGAGTVIKSEYREGYGHRIEVSHGKDAQGREIVTTYSHLDGRKVSVGDQVDASTVLGGVGNSGGDYGTHLHYEVLVGGKKVDPSSVSGVAVTGRPGAPGVPADARLSSAAMRDAVDKYVAANPGISEARKQALYAAADRAVAQGRADRAQAEADVDRRVTDWLNQNRPGADDLTDMGQIPASVLEGASPGLVSALQQRVQAATSRIEARESAEAAARVKAIERGALIELESLSDSELAQTDLTRYVGRADDLVLARKWKRQKELREKPGSSVSSDKIVRATGIAADILAIDRDKNPEEWARLRGAIEAELMEMDPSKLDGETLRSIAVEQTQKVVVDGTGFLGIGEKSLRRYELQGREDTTYRRTGDAIPKGARAYLDRNFPNASQHEKYEIYERAKARNLEWTFK